MADHHEQLDPIERMLGDLTEAERGGVFRRTMVNTASLVGASSRPRAWLSRTRKLAWIPAAACVVLAVGIGTLALRTGVTPLGGYQKMAGNVSSVDAALDFVGFNECLAGPSGGVANGCVAYDQDQDGDVDLVDFTAYQLTRGR